MLRTLTANRWLLVLAGVLDAAIAITYFLMANEAGPITFHNWNTAVLLIGRLSIAAAVCCIAAGLWTSAEGRHWPLVANGVALGALGILIVFFTRYRIAFLAIALLVITMALSLAALGLQIARRPRRDARTQAMVFGTAGAAAAAFTLPFLALGFRWVQIEPGSHPDLLWLGAFFAFSAIYVFGLAVRPHSPDADDRPVSPGPLTPLSTAPRVVP